MKKMLSLLLVAGALGAAGLAQADQGACVTRGICDNINPEAGGDANGNYDVRLAEQRGLVPPGTAAAANKGYGNYGVYSPYGVYGPYAGWLPQANNYYGYTTPYTRNSRDRDGDGVRNNRDRYPDDPRYQ